MIDISVIIPTYNRPDRLLNCLAALERQTVERRRFEIIVVDDGSTDDTSRLLQPLAEEGRIRYFRQPNSGPAAARNLAIREAQGSLLLIIGDDIIATPQLLAEHLSYHQRLDRPGLAVLGFTDWSPEITVTPLMRCEGLAAQFEYYLIPQGLVDAENLPYRFFYTSNISLPRRFMLENHFFFDEEFLTAMGEDGELAYRMQKKGMRIVFNPNAIAYHEHPTSFESICRRMFNKGQVAVLQAFKIPEMGDLSYLNLRFKGKVKRRLHLLLVKLLEPLLSFADRRGWDINRFSLMRLYDFVFGVYVFEGLLSGLQLYNLQPVDRLAAVELTGAGEAVQN